MACEDVGARSGQSRLVLANMMYAKHVTDEGLQLQNGLRSAGWLLAGRETGIDTVDVGQILKIVDPSMVFVQDVRDWDRWSPGCFDLRYCFEGIEILGRWDGFKSTVVKDAGTVVGYQEWFSRLIRPDAIVIYYHHDSVVKAAPWLSEWRLVRTHHSVDGKLCGELGFWQEGQHSKRCIVSGAIKSAANVYPMRLRAMRAAKFLDADVMLHPGYGVIGNHTPEYLRIIGEYKVHVATASRYGFALRKIIESVAVGCTPVTDLPACDVLPEIDGALVRVHSGIAMEDLKRVIDEAEASWNAAERREWARRAIARYDYRIVGAMLSRDLEALA